MNECGVVNTDCYDPGNRRIEEKSTNDDRLGIIIIDIGLPANKRASVAAEAASLVGKTAMVTC